MAHLTPERVQQIYGEFGQLRVLDDIIQHRAKDNPPKPIVGYPRNENNPSDYETFTGKQLDTFVDGAVKYYLHAGLKSNERKVIGVFASSNVHYLVTFFALSRLGYKVLCISLRLPPVAIINIIRLVNCNTIVYGGNNPQLLSTLEAVNDEVPLVMVTVPVRAEYENPIENTPRFIRDFDPDIETNETGLVMHSSGSTGLPKPVLLSHKSVLTHPVQGTGLHNFGALPLYHMYGLSTTLQAMYMAKTANLPSATIPMTADTLMAAIDAIKPDVFHAVPYALGLLVEHPRALDFLKNAKIVTAAGARTPDELGDRLVSEGVNFGVVFGTTEAGLLGDTMYRPSGDDSWNYVRIYNNIRKSIQMEAIGNNQFECVYLGTHPGLFKGAAEGDGSWRSKDVFTPHPTIPDVWKYITRLDDRITLSNGEKVLPLPIEGCIRQHNLIREAIVFGVDRSIPGLLVFRVSDDIPDEELLEEIWPIIMDANSRAEGFSQIVREMVVFMPSGVLWPKTDKGSIIRAQVYRQFVDEINAAYEGLEGGQEGDLRLDLRGTEAFLESLYKDIMGTQLDSIEADFFTAGIDSLKAIQMRRLIQKKLFLGGAQLTANTVYEYGNVTALAAYLHSLAQGDGKVTGDSLDRVPLIRELIQKYSTFGQTAILTGATGSLGAHVLAQMLDNPGFCRVYCFSRGDDPRNRVLQSLAERGLKPHPSTLSKIVAINADPSKPDYGVSGDFVEQLKREVTLIVHLAWPVNFNIPLQSFEQHLVGLRNLLDLSLRVQQPTPARLWYASSISTAENTPGPVMIPDEPVNDFTYALNMGYAQSKLVGEHMVLNAARAGARAYILRIGQIVGDIKVGAWNDAEFIPSMIRSALTMKMLPLLEDQCSWIPVDTLATAVLELDQFARSASLPRDSDAQNPPVVYNMTNPEIFEWSDLLDSLAKAGLDFERVSFATWLDKLKESGSVVGNEVTNPAVKLISHFESRLEATQKEAAEAARAGKLNKIDGVFTSGRAQTNGYTNGHTNRHIYGYRNGHALTNGHSEEDKYDALPRRGVLFQTKSVRRDSKILRIPPNIIDDGYVAQFLKYWLARWTKSIS